MYYDNEILTRTCFSLLSEKVHYIKFTQLLLVDVYYYDILVTTSAYYLSYLH